MRPETEYLDAQARVLACVKAAGERGITTMELIAASNHSRAVGRLWELRKVYEIEDHKAGRVHRWVYRGVKPTPSLLQLMERA